MLLRLQRSPRWLRLCADEYSMASLARSSKRTALVTLSVLRQFQPRFGFRLPLLVKSDCIRSTPDLLAVTLPGKVEVDPPHTAVYRMFKDPTHRFLPFSLSMLGA